MGDHVVHPGQYRRSVGKLIYLINCRHDISFGCGMLSQCMWSSY